MTKELTDEQIEDIAEPMQWYEGDIECISQVQFARAVIAADRELQDARWREELNAYALTCSNLRAELAGRVPGASAMANRLMSWPLPKGFNPDCGISFDGRKDDEWNKGKTWPTGTNLLDHAQAKAMFEYVLAAAPQPYRSNIKEAP